MSHALDRLHLKLIHAIIKWDESDTRREAKRGHVNIYRYGHLQLAAQEAEEEAIANGGTIEAYRDAVISHFNPNPHIRTFLRKNVDATVDVDRGRWVVNGEKV